MDTAIRKVDLGDYRAIEADRSGFQKAFVSEVTRGQTTLGKVLDIGCGDTFHDYLQGIARLIERHDGIDPTDAVLRHANLTERWQGDFETAELHQDFYDTAIAFNVLEHIEAAQPFFRKVRSVLRPGGRFWALTPNATHPFGVISNLFRVLRLKLIYKSLLGNEGINDYPAYYRLNTPAAVIAAIQDLGFCRADFWYVPSMQWDTYFPKWMRFIPHLYDRAIGLRRGKNMGILFFCLTADQSYS